MKKVEGVDQEGGHLGVLFVRHRAHSINQAQGEELKEVKLEGGRPPALSEVKYRKVLVVVVLEQVRDYAEEVEEVDLEEALVDMGAEALRLRLQQEGHDLSRGDGDRLAPGLREAHKVVQELLDGALDSFLCLQVALVGHRLPSELSNLLKSNQHQARDKVNLLVGGLAHE